MPWALGYARRVSGPPPTVSVSQRNHRRVFCAEEGCGRYLGTGFPESRDCPFCGGTTKHVNLGFAASLTFSGRVKTVRSFYRTRPGWAAIQLFVLLAGPLDGAAIGSTLTGTTSTVVGAVVGFVFGLVGAFGLPPWQESIEEHRWTEP
jgi:hypothetical protein